MTTPANLSSANPWRTAVISTAVVLAVMLAIGAGAYAIRKSPTLHAATPTSSTSARQVDRQVVEDCNRYAVQTQRDTGHIVKDGAIGGAVGAGVGAAGGAIAKGGEGAGKGAGIGALLGAAIGAWRGLSDENQKTEAARTAYADCLARRGY